MRVPILPPPGLNSDSTDYAAPGVWSSGSNVRFFHGLPQAIGGEKTLQSGALETYGQTTRLLAYKFNNITHVAVAGFSTLYRVNTTNWTRAAITPASGWVGVGTWQSLDMFGDVLLASTHDGSGTAHGTLFASVGGAAAAAVANAPDNINAFLVTPSRQVMALGCNEEVSTTYNGRCIRWSDIEDYTDWTTLSSNNAGEYILPGQDDIVGGRVVGDYIAIWTKSALWLAQYIGQPSETFKFNRIDNTGLLSRHCHAELQGTLYWMGSDLFVYQWRPGTVPQKIECPCLIDVWDDMGVDQSTGPTDPNYYHAVAIRKYGEIWFFYASPGAGTTDKYLAYCVNESIAAQKQVWFRGSMRAGAAIDDPLLVDGFSMADSNAIRIENAASKALISFDQIGNSPTYPAWNIQSSAYYIDEGQRRVQIQRYVADSHGESGEFKLSLLLKDYPETASATTKGPYTITPATPTLKQDFRASGRLVSVKFESSDVAARWRLGKPVFEVVALGNR